MPSLEDSAERWNVLKLDRSKLTPMMAHYALMKEKYPQALLMYRCGDFYETFFQDAYTVARELELVLTGRPDKHLGRIPMAGVPHHAMDRHASQLVQKGYAIAICEQLESAEQAKGLISRDVSRVITPGTILEEGLLAARKNNYLAAIVLTGRGPEREWGLAYADISTGEFWVTQHRDVERLSQELLRLQPAEILLPVDETGRSLGLFRPGEAGGGRIPEGLPNQFCYTLRPQRPFDLGEARSELILRFNVKSLEGFGCERLPLAVRAAGGLLHYLSETRKDTPLNLERLQTYGLDKFLIIDHQTRRNLELLQTVRDGVFHGSLLWALDRTRTAMGGRALRRWMLQPLLGVSGIQQRQDGLAELVGDGHLRTHLQAALNEVYDLERLAGRAGSGTANARDLVGLANSLEKLPELARLLEGAQALLLRRLKTVDPELEKLGQRLRQTLVEHPPLTLTEGGLIRSGVDSALDELRQQIESDRQWIASLETTERQRTGVSTLKVGFTKAFGYYISISRAKSRQAPDDYIRKQTLVNEERYITPELKEREARILTAQAEMQQLEYELFLAIRLEVGGYASLIREVAEAIATADILAGLAEIAIYHNYCRPEIVSDRTLNLVDSRHPVVEQSLPNGMFVSNSLKLGTKKSADLMVLTGPNMSGKSTYLRQVGLVQVMAQMGSFVPAEFAELGICDRIFTRVGAVDDLATGQSTFMVEMNETANILNHASDRSLVLLDEIGRGTATFDGLSIAWAVAEYLAKELKPRTIFATHYHELNELASLLPNVANYQVIVKEMDDDIIFLHQVKPGGANQSYGIEVGRLAGLPSSVISRAREVLKQVDRHSHIAVGLRNSHTNGNGKNGNGKNGRSKSLAEIPGTEQGELPF
ncbi:MAG: DNA mismatch repair protein MutS [Synechococcus sp.]